MTVALPSNKSAGDFPSGNKCKPETTAATSIRNVPKKSFTFLLVIAASLFLALNGMLGETLSPKVGSDEATITNALELNSLASHPEPESRFFNLKGVVLWVSTNRIILQDDSGGVAINIDSSNQLSLKPGQIVQLQAHCLVGGGKTICSALVNNDGKHKAIEAMGRVFLSEGLHPIRVEWFNALGLSALDVDWQGPGISRQPIPSNCLFQNLDSEANKPASGLDYSCYEGEWNQLPDFSSLPVLKRGIVSNFDISIRPRAENVGVVYEGYLKIPANGTYTFWAKSDDGSKLFIGYPPMRLKILGIVKLPPPSIQILQLVPGQPVLGDYNFRWATVKGRVTFVSDTTISPYIELSSDTGRTRLELANKFTDSLKYLLGCQIKAVGICSIALSTEEQPEFSLLVPGLKQLTILEPAPTYWDDYPLVSIRSLEEDTKRTSHTFVHISGIVSSNLPGKLMVISDKTGSMTVQTAQPLPQIGETVEALGIYARSHNITALDNGFYRAFPTVMNSNLIRLPLLTEAIRVKRLDRAEAQRGYPVKIRGVVTARVGGGFILQDSTWSIFFRPPHPQLEELPGIGDFIEIDAKTVFDFAPSVNADKVIDLGPGTLPMPIHPTWDELINGSLDTEYVEIQGVVVSAEVNTLSLFTRGGKLSLEFPDFDAQMLKGLKYALVRIRGVSSPNRDDNQQVIVASLRFLNASINVDQAAPKDPFDIPLKRIPDLLLFDLNANALQRVKVAGQIIHKHHSEYFLTDGTNGLRFRLQTPTTLRIGDTVDVVGFPNLNGATPSLQDALARRIGNTKLPAAKVLSAETLLDSKLDATLVSIQGNLVDSSIDGDEQVLEMQVGNQNFEARLENRDGILPRLLPRSLLSITGVYAGQGEDLPPSGGINSFQLLLNSPLDIHVISRPSWWTIQHALIILGGMMVAFFGATIWIVQLRRQLEKRSRHLAIEIQCREQAEHQQKLEEERSRIARDLHDDLGATLTQIRFLSAVKSSDPLVPETTREQLKKVSEKSRQTVASLDEIVWAINPANDSVRSLVAYLRHTAAEFFRTSTINCRFDVDKILPEASLTSEERHNLYLAVREALNNSAKHSQATELWLRIHWQEQKETLKIIIEDNGCGFINHQTITERNGLINMRQRMEKIGGHFEFDVSPGSGTTCRLILPIK